MYYGYILSIIIFLSCVIIGFIYWYKTEKSREGKRAIIPIPQYEPPQNLRPAMAEVIIKEKLTNKGLAATIIDLAVRGYVRIEEEKKGKFEKYILIIIIAMFLVVPFIIIINGTFRVNDFIFFLVFGVILFSILSKSGFKIEVQKDYVVKKIKDYNNNFDLEEYEKEYSQELSGFKNYFSIKNDSNLEDYEKKYLQALFSSGDHFSTKELKKSPSKSRALYEKMQKVKDKIYEETELDTKAFEVGVSEEKKKTGIWIGIAMVVFFISLVIGNAGIEIGQPLILIATAILSAAGLYAFIKYEARLSDSGIKLKEDWLGFKMYLETAEKYRMQNLKPEYFEKYLPYAMIFGVEKKWARAFEAMNIPQPTWYGGNAVVAGHIGSANVASSFSPSAFSSSFASSFSSAFSSSGASGASGGGGGAGGGGGGGGGGAG